MTKLRTLILVLVLCGVAPTASADDFWTASIPGDTALFGAPAVVMPTVGAPAVVTPTYVAPRYFAPSYEVPSYRTPTFGAATHVAPRYVAPTHVAPRYFAPTFVSPRVVAPAVVVPRVVVPSAGIVSPLPCDDYSGYDDYTDLLVLDQLETMNRTLRDIESHMREALHQEAWDRMLGRYRN